MAEIGDEVDDMEPEELTMMFLMAMSNEELDELRERIDRRRRIYH